MIGKIEPASYADVSMLAAIIRESFAKKADQFLLTLENAPTHPSNCQDGWITTALNKGIKYYLASLDGTVCGCVAVEQASPEVCYMERLAVLPAFRRKGLGRELVEHVTAEVVAMGANKLEIGIIKRDNELRRWYLNLGFNEKNSAEFEQLPFEVLFMVLELN